MKHTVRHGLGLSRARFVVEHASEGYRQRLAQHAPRLQWVSPSRADIEFVAKGLRVCGSIELDDETIRVELKVPLLLRPFRSAALQVIEGEIRKWVARAEAGEV